MSVSIGMSRSAWLSRVRESLSNILIFGALAIAAIGWYWYESQGHHAEGEESAPAEVADLWRVIEIPTEKWERAAFVTAPVTQQNVAQATRVLGEVSYDLTRFITLPAPADLIIDQVQVTVGSDVELGQVLATATSSQIGSDRAEIIRLYRELHQIQQRHERANAIHEGLDRLLALVSNQVDAAELLPRVANESLGEYRGQVIEAASAAQLAETLLKQAQAASESGAMSGKVLQERAAARDAALATLASVCDVAKFEAQQLASSVAIELTHQEQELAIAVAGLERRLGTSGITADSIAATPNHELARFDIKASRAGTIAKISLSEGMRVASGSTLVEIADLSKLWVRAWWRAPAGSAQSPPVGTPVSFTAVDDPARTSIGTLAFASTGFDERAKAWPVVIAFDDPDRQWRSGLLVRVELPMEAAQSAIVVPSSSVLEHEGKAFVFQSLGERKYQRVDVNVKWSDDLITVLETGPDLGTEIVVQNAFFLKSELLLEAEE